MGSFRMAAMFAVAASAGFAATGAEAQTRYFARQAIAGISAASSSTGSTGSSGRPVAPPAISKASYSGEWQVRETGRICSEGYYEALPVCHSPTGGDLPDSSCDPAKKPFTQPPCGSEMPS